MLVVTVNSFTSQCLWPQLAISPHIACGCRRTVWPGIVCEYRYTVVSYSSYRSLLYIVSTGRQLSVTPLIAHCFTLWVQVHNCAFSPLIAHYFALFVSTGTQLSVTPLIAHYFTLFVSTGTQLSVTPLIAHYFTLWVQVHSCQLFLLSLTTLQHMQYRFHTVGNVTHICHFKSVGSS